MTTDQRQEFLQILHEYLNCINRTNEALDYLEQSIFLTKPEFPKEKHMLDPTTVAVIKQIDDATNAIGTRIANFISAAAVAGGATAAEINAALAPEVAKLTSLAADPNNPVPPQV